MEITRNFYNQLRRHCTVELLECINDIRVANGNNNVWDITQVIDEENCLYEQMKVAYTFEQLGGTLLYKGVNSQYVILTNRINNIVFDNIRLYWIHNEANGVFPIYDIGKLDVPPILPKYVSTQQEDGSFVIEKLRCGEYIALPNEVYWTEDCAKERAKQLNLNG